MRSSASLLSLHPHQPCTFLSLRPKRYLNITSLSVSSPISSLPISSSASSRRTSLIVRSKTPEGESVLNSEGSSACDSAPSSPSLPEKPSGSGTGFGAAGTAVSTKTKRKGKGRSNVVRRSPIEKIGIFSTSGESKSSSPGQQGASEGAFLLAWLGLGLLILIEGVALSVSGFLPEQWDNFISKYLYPSFTPTVVVFFGGTVAYGVLKYLQSDKANK
ncbi:hypothetical protein HPP92_002073 [Vanilla planifolia]|uniref:Protein LOW PSII ACCUMULATION 2, chloroplastic n=1 Tax=Vanilla planifolia TaxID=51239 RepID=A0A835S4L5_VANPL|nr:hypothetical protein HPP92_002073 [Vanilla planifolia]